MKATLRVCTLAMLAFVTAGPASSLAASYPWSDPTLSPDARADMVVAQMTFEEKMSLVHGNLPMRMKTLPDGVVMSAGYFPGVPRLGIPSLRETDASLGIANARRDNDDATALPSSMALAATWNPEIAFAGGAMAGKQTRQKGFNILLAGGVNLTRDPFNGRNFEYLGEDPLLAGLLAGASIRGIQSQHVVSTAKHFVLNAQETGRYVLDARIGEAALRESDLLAFQIALEKGDPGSVMCAYNKINGFYACEHHELLTNVLKKDWGFKGWVMSDWGAVHSVGAANAGLDQESGEELDKLVYFDAPLRAALAAGEVSQARVDDMVRRVLRGMFANGLMNEAPDPGPLNTAADNAVAQAEAEAGLVLLKNNGSLLPLSPAIKRIAVIGAHADQGVLSGSGSSQVVPAGSFLVPLTSGIPGFISGMHYHPSAPLEAIRARLPGASVVYEGGTDIPASVIAAKGADVVVLFVEQWTGEARDTELNLSKAQEDLIHAVTAANPKTVVVLENGGPLFMPWIEKPAALVEAWYAGGRGGEAIARILFGEVNPSGRLPVTFAARADQLPRDKPPGLGVGFQSANPQRSDEMTPFAIDYKEGSSVGYRWFAEQNHKPLFPFGFGLSYTRFRYSALTVNGGETLNVKLSVSNTGRRAGVETAQVYLRNGPSRHQRRLLGWAQVALKPGETRQVTVAVDPRLLANWDETAHAWRVDAGRYDIFAGPNAEESAVTGAAQVTGRTLKP